MTAIEFNYALQINLKTLKPFALRLTRDLEDANDLVQDTLMKAFLNRNKFCDGTNLKAWLYTIMKNTFLSNYQKMVRKNTFIDNTENLQYINANKLVENEATNKFVSDDIKKALSKIDEAHSAVFMLYYDGYKYDEIAKKLKLPLGTVKNRIHLARKDLKDILRLYEFGES